MKVPDGSAEAPTHYSEAEFVRILSFAAELQDKATVDPPRGRMTLKEIQSIAAEVGIDSRHVAAAAAIVSTDAGEQWTSWLGTPVRGGVTRVLGGSLPKSSWKDAINVIRQTMQQDGRHSYVPGALEWIHADAGSEVRVEISDAGGRTHVQIVADHREAAALYLAVGPVLGAAVSVIPIAAFGLGGAVDPWLVIGSGAVVGTATAWTGLKAVSSRWKRRIRSLVQELSEVAETHSTEADG